MEGTREIHGIGIEGKRVWTLRREHEQKIGRTFCSVVVGAIGEGAKALVLGCMNRDVEDGVATLELGLGESMANMSDGDKERGKVVVHSFARYSWRDCQANWNFLATSYAAAYKRIEWKQSVRGWIWVPMCSLQWNILSRKSSIFGMIWVPYGIRWP